MTDTYSVRIGRARRKNPPKSYSELLSLPYRVANDDGKQVECGTRPWPTNVICPDCERAIVMWAEACYTPGHRICPLCGSHFELCSPATKGGQWFLRRARFGG
jgi:hypothetical protein